ncbi:NAD-dependent protein deacetylase sirtuin-1-like [Panonychus citri]|uniref:NAD-dependent protein deacetylase sirtuin-1-like n=1 Tax=Panonychus citri TaxID=50023 RepID=UPI00230747BA|nr:NAD-dependent protein deacetylase sirtuin-1-like [Panonychus citri]XP_053211747.1 NAD-dependent protein deacetylase sirtuin-1-like [Panonychus citri]XP_053211749.1 NAD-dependent protein deacetylase sirtuin-1-like [Panonychus citri]XP_053211750.1 NAD-dependent protein deacetylase sirtuin-1-like [Panonychus citri]
MSSESSRKLPTMLSEGGDGDNCNNDNLLGCNLNDKTINGKNVVVTTNDDFKSLNEASSSNNSRDSWTTIDSDKVCDGATSAEDTRETGESSRSGDQPKSPVSELSCGSSFSSESEDKWRPTSGPMQWLQQQMILGTDPRNVLREVLPEALEHLPPRVDNLILWKILLNLFSEPPPRKKLPHVNTLDDVVDLIRNCSNIIVLTGAGVSVSCGIPDFRSANGVYARLRKVFPDLPDPQAMFDIQYFKEDPRPFFKFAKEIYPGQFQPSIAHKFIKLIEEQNKLLRNYTQNIDTLEKAAGIEKVITCHGSFATATCMRCGYKTNSDAIKADIFAQNLPLCPECPEDSEPLPVIKPDIVFFGEGLSDEFHDSMALDKDKCDLLIVMGSSMKVRPVALIPNAIPPDVPRVLINREPLEHICFDVELLGDCDDVIQQISRKLGGVWLNLCESDSKASSSSERQQGRGLDDTNNNSDIDSSESSSSDTFKSSSSISSPVAPIKEETSASMLTIPETSNCDDDSMEPGPSHEASSSSSLI